MRQWIRLLVLAGAALVTAAQAARADVCVAIDRSVDTFGDADRAAALTLLSQQLEAQQIRVGTADCEVTYTLAHVRLGDTITITLSRPGGSRQVRVTGMNEVPAAYSQLVRALITGRQVGSLAQVVDRTNVLAAQASPRRAQADSLFYTRLGFGGTAKSSAGPSFGLGVRREMDAFAIDVSFFNFQRSGERAGLLYDGGGSSGSWVKLEMLRFANRTGGSSAYWGGGLSWGTVNRSTGSEYTNGSGLQGELTAGYELLRASNIRMFLQTDIALPFYTARSVDYGSYYTRPAQAPVSTRRYLPSAAVSIGLGWGRSGQGP